MDVDINDIVVGACGICGGPVVVPKIWFGTTLPPKSCKSCGATVRESYGPRLPMNPKPVGSHLFPRAGDFK